MTRESIPEVGVLITILEQAETATGTQTQTNTIDTRTHANTHSLQTTCKFNSSSTAALHAQNIIEPYDNVRWNYLRRRVGSRREK